MRSLLRLINALVVPKLGKDTVRLNQWKVARAIDETKAITATATSVSGGGFTVSSRPTTSAPSGPTESSAAATSVSTSTTSPGSATAPASTSTSAAGNTAQSPAGSAPSA